MNALRRFGVSTLAVFKEVPATLQRRSLLLLVACQTGVVAAAITFLHRWDPTFEAFARDQQREALVYFAQKLSAWGELHMAPLFALVAVAVVGKAKRLPRLLWASLAGLLSGGVGGILVNGVKIIVGRPRPCTPIADGIHWFTTGWDYASFPSGHATHCFAIAAGVSVLSPRLGTVFAVGALAVCWSRWYLVRHYVTDVAAGAWLGIVIGFLIGLAARKAWERSASSDVVGSKQTSHA